MKRFHLQLTSMNLKHWRQRQYRKQMVASNTVRYQDHHHHLDLKTAHCCHSQALQKKEETCTEKSSVMLALLDHKLMHSSMLEIDRTNEYQEFKWWILMVKLQRRVLCSRSFKISAPILIHLRRKNQCYCVKFAQNILPGGKKIRAVFDKLHWAFFHFKNEV